MRIDLYSYFPLLQILIQNEQKTNIKLVLII